MRNLRRRLSRRLLPGILVLALLASGPAGASALIDIPIQPIKPIDPIIRVDPSLLTLPTTNAGNASPQWSYPIIEPPTVAIPVGPPAVSPDGTSYVGVNVVVLVALGGLITAVGDNGQKLWDIGYGEPLVAAPVVGPDGTLYVCIGNYSDASGSLVALNADGSEKWRAAVGLIGSAPIVGPDGTIYAAVRGGTLYAINPKDGSTKWFAKNAVDSPAALAAGADGTIYAASAASDLLFAFKPNGSRKWTFKAAGKIVTAPVVGGDGTIYAGVSDNSLVAVRPGGSLLWTVALGAAPTAPALGEDGTIDVGADKTMFAIQKNGTVKWKAGFAAAVTSPTIGARGTVQFMTANGMVQTLNQADGSLQWRYRIPLDIVTKLPPAPKPNGSVLAVSTGKDGKLELVSLRVPVTELKLDQANLALQTGQSALLNASLAPSNASNQGVAWSSSNATIASVDASGRVTGISSGKATIKAVSGDNPSKFATAEVTVSDSPDAVSVEGIALNPASLTVETGRSKQLTVKFAPSNATNRAVTWSSSAPGTVQVSSSGRVTGLTEGSAVITATAVDGGYFATATVTVVQGAGSPAFTDLKGHWAEDDILDAYERKVVNGYPDFSFHPDGSVTRAEFAVMLMNGLKPAQAGDALAFKDAGGIGTWAKASVAQAVKLGIISGYPDGTFRPNSNITHAEMAALVFKASGLGPEADASTRYADDSSLPKWARGAISAAEKNGIIIVGGYTSATFAPLALATRAEAAASIVRLLDLLGK